VSGAAAVSERWRVHLPTALETRVRAVSRAGPRDPWPSARALDALLAAGAERDGPPRTAGAGAGRPLIAAQRVRWAGLELEVECVAMTQALVECNLIAPPWDELTGGAEGEDAWWDLADGFLAAVDARHGALVDGEAVELDDPTPATLAASLRRHLGVLVPEWLAGSAGAAADAYLTLPRSGLVVLLR
jgi:hypothetical protein